MSDPEAVAIVRQSLAALGGRNHDTTRLLVMDPLTGPYWTGITFGDLRAVLAHIDSGDQ